MKHAAGFFRVCLLAAVACTAVSAQSRTAAALLEQARQATGGDAWNRYAECVSDGTLQVLVDGRSASGTLHYAENLHTGANVSDASIPALGVHQNAGVDASQSWSLDRDGNVSLHPADNPWQVDDLYLTRRGYWRPGFGGAQVAILAPQADAGITFDLLRVQVPGGHGFTLWISRRTHRIERLDWNVLREYSDFRRIGGVLLPFTFRDAGGAQQVTIFTSRTLLPSIRPADFAIPIRHR